MLLTLVLGFSKREVERKPRAISRQMSLSLCLSTRETAQEKRRSPRLAEGLLLLSCSSEREAMQTCVKRWAREGFRSGIFLLRVGLVLSSVRLLGSYHGGLPGGDTIGLGKMSEVGKNWEGKNILYRGNIMRKGTEVKNITVSLGEELCCKAGIIQEEMVGDETGEKFRWYNGLETLKKPHS